LGLRRNEVAHGILFDIEPITAFRMRLHPSALGKPNYGIIAPYYALRQHDQDGLPNYAYTSASMKQLFLRMADAYDRISFLRQRLLT
jgi:hypothetical protein